MDHVDQECSRPHSLMVMLTVRSSVEHPAANREGFGGTRCLLLSKMGQTSRKQPYHSLLLSALCLACTCLQAQVCLVMKYCPEGWIHSATTYGHWVIESE